MNEIKFFWEYLEGIGQVRQTLGELMSEIRFLSKSVDERFNSLNRESGNGETAKHEQKIKPLSDLKDFIRN